jgi:hypothetical protein
VALKGRQVIQGLNTTLNDLAKVMEAQDSMAVKETVSFEAAASKAVKALSHQFSQAKAEINESFVVQDISFPSIYLDNIKSWLKNNRCFTPWRKNGFVVKLRKTPLSGGIPLTAGIQ